MNNCDNELSKLPKNVKLLYYDSLIPNKNYCVYRTGYEFFYGIKKTCFGTFVKNTIFEDKVGSCFNDYCDRNGYLFLNMYHAVNPINKNEPQKYYFFELRNLPNDDEKKRIRKMHWYVIQKIFLEPEFRENILGHGLKHIGSIDVSCLKNHFFFEN